MKYLEKTYKIPSNGVFEGPKKITLREMTTREEKIILGSKDFSVFERLVKSCTVDDTEVNFDNLHNSDIMYLIFMLRELTYGPEYFQKVTCPHCNHEQEISIDINEMSIDVLTDAQVKELSQGVTIELSNGDKVTVHMISLGLSRQIERTIKTRVKQGRVKDPQSFEMMMRLANSIDIESAEDTETDYTKIENKIGYIDGLRMRDLSKIQNALNDYNFGINRNIYRECENCGEDMEVIGYIVPEFFHPSK